MIPDRSPKNALLIGATGLVGKQVLHNLLNSPHYQEVTVLTRKSLHIEHTRLREILFDFDHPDRSVVKADDVFCCMGTTIKKAGSQEAFRKVDLEYPLKIAALAKQNGAQQYLIVTAMGADSKSLIFYNRVKGEVQDQLAMLNYHSLHYLQPSLLLGNRDEKRFGERIGEVLAKVFEPAMIGSLKKYRAIESSRVAKAMVTLAQDPAKGIFTHDSARLQEY